jgi:valyl-tRNA synthetase
MENLCKCGSVATKRLNIEPENGFLYCCDNPKCKEELEIFLRQVATAGARQEYFTMNDDYYKAVIRVFVDLYKKGYIYKGKRIINWDCEAKTALSNEEVIYKDTPEKSKLFHIKYAIKGSSA